MRLVFGRGRHKRIGELIKPFAGRVLLHYGGGSIKRCSTYGDIISSIEAAGIEYIELGGVRANPELGLVNEGARLCREHGVGLILAVGGGSVIDSAKGIAIGAVPENGDVWKYFTDGGPISGALPIATVLTIPAAGSEQSPDTVISHQDRKLGYSSQKLRPVVSVINPELFFTLPPCQIANGVSDMMSHIMERYFTNTTHTELIDGLCESTLRTIMGNGPRLLENPEDYDAWAEVSLAGSFCHNGFLGVGREQDWACHDMEHELSAVDPGIAHGAGLAVITPAWMDYVRSANTDMFSRFACNVMGVGDITRAIEKLRRFYRAMGLPSSITELGLDGGVLDEMARKCTQAPDGGAGTIGGLRKLGRDDVLAIYKAAL
ncbi:MAG: iron-containing alcohol dehydrogenase [Oscillospiraceae bacterium]|nr:iron-containing alcohol dehydrogenase [Oscillospiraceae bacterium]